MTFAAVSFILTYMMHKCSRELMTSRCPGRWSIVALYNINKFFRIVKYHLIILASNI